LIKTPEGFEFYVPMVEEYVVEMDFSSRTIIVQNLEGLIEVQKP
jgi:16S rRNA processing protein RimM